MPHSHMPHSPSRSAEAAAERSTATTTQVYASRKSPLRVGHVQEASRVEPPSTRRGTSGLPNKVQPTAPSTASKPKSTMPKCTPRRDRRTALPQTECLESRPDARPLPSARARAHPRESETQQALRDRTALNAAAVSKHMPKTSSRATGSTFSRGAVGNLRDTPRSNLRNTPRPARNADSLQAQRTGTSKEASTSSPSGASTATRNHARAAMAARTTAAPTLASHAPSVISKWSTAPTRPATRARAPSLYAEPTAPIGTLTPISSLTDRLLNGRVPAPHLL